MIGSKRNLLGRLASACLLVVASPCQSAAQIPLPQTNQLEFGRNLIAFQVLRTNPSPAAVFGSNIFRAVWRYENATVQWHQFGRSSPAQQEQNQIVRMGNIELGRAYWAYFDAALRTNRSVQVLLPNRAYTLKFSQ